jgi:hypothetical protein
MNYRTSLLAAGAAAALAGLANAQVDYSFNWHSMNFGFLGGAAFTSGPVLFGFGQTVTNFAGPGDSIRICHGIDSTQGGRMQTGGASDVSWFSLTQGWGALNTVPGVDYGLVSFHAASVNSVAGDACFSSFFAQGTDAQTGQPVVLNSALSAAFVPGLIAATAATPVPTFWFNYFQFLGSTGLLTPNTLGVQPGPFAAPLLTHLIMEVQGPLNGGPTNQQYFVLSTAELNGSGNGTIGAGGVTNGNSRQASSLFGVSADASGAISHNRLTSFAGAGISGTTNTQFGGGPGTDQWFGTIGTVTPALWAAQNGNTGGGGPDWRVSNQSSICNLRVLDMLAGAQGSALAVPAGPATSVTNPGLAANFPFFLWSATPGAGMIQSPMSWDAIPGVIAQAGSLALGPQATSRDGLQTVPINFDAVTNAFLAQSVFSVGANFQSAQDPTTGGTAASLFEDGVGLGIDGSASFTVAQGLPVGPKPNLANRNIGVAAVGIQFDIFTFSLSLTEFASSLTLSLQ